MLSAGLIQLLQSIVGGMIGIGSGLLNHRIMPLQLYSTCRIGQVHGSKVRATLAFRAMLIGGIIMPDPDDWKVNSFDRVLGRHSGKSDCTRRIVNLISR
jgi:hypothetical protein